MIMNYQNVMTFSGVFFGPLSTKQTEAFTLKITNKAGQVIIQDSQAMTLNDIEQAEMQKATTQ